MLARALRSFLSARLPASQTVLNASPEDRGAAGATAPRSMMLPGGPDSLSRNLQPAPDHDISLGEPAPAAIAATPDPAPLASSSPTDDFAALLPDLECLGDSPELGLVRARLRPEPGGLLDFATMYPAALVVLLQSRFAGIGAPEHLAVKRDWGHYFTVDTRYDLTWHSQVKVESMDHSAILAREAARLSRLRDQLLLDLASGSKLFVYAGPATPPQIADIRTAMGSYGDNTLLHLMLADADHPAGQVERPITGLLRGRLRRYGAQDGQWNIALDDWATVGLAGHALWRAGLPH